MQFDKSRLPTANEALPGRSEAMPISGKHFVSGHTMVAPFPEGLEQAVVGADEPAPVGGGDDRGPVAAHARIDDAQEHCVVRERRDQRGEKIGGRAGRKCRCVVHQVDHGNGRRLAGEDGLHLADIRAVRAEIGEHDDHGISMPPASGRRQAGPQVPVAARSAGVPAQTTWLRPPSFAA